LNIYFQVVKPAFKIKGDIIIQKFNKDWETFIDVTENEEITSGGKYRVIKVTTNDENIQIVEEFTLTNSSFTEVADLTNSEVDIEEVVETTKISKSNHEKRVWNGH